MALKIAGATQNDHDHAPGHPHPRDHPWRPLLVRMHFYAGILVGPLIVIAALTGVLYVFTPPLERAVYARELVADPAGRSALPLQTQVEAAVRATPQLRLAGVKATHDPDETTRVDFADPALPPMSAHSVYVDPYTAQVRGNLVTRHGGTPLTSWIGTLHGDLQLGTPGRVYAELASHWLVVLTLGGLILWWERSARHRGWRARGFWRRLVVVDRSRPGLHRTLSWHSVVGGWSALVVLAIAVTGLMVGLSSGPRWTDFLASQGAATPRLSAVLPGRPAGGSAPPPGGAAQPSTGHDHGAMDVPTPAAGTPRADGVPRPGQLPSGASLDALLRGAGRAHVTESVTLTAPRAPGQGWTASEGDLSWPVNLDQAVLDPSTGDAVRTMSWDSWPTLAKANRLLLFFHFGRTLGLANDILLVVGMAATIAVVVWGYRMWWQRRPHHPGLRFGRPPRRGVLRHAPRGRLALGLAVVIAWGIVMPVFGLSVLAFLVVDVLVGLVRGPGTRGDAAAPDVEMVV